jgi:hypothetical protein
VIFAGEGGRVVEHRKHLASKKMRRYRGPG